MTKHAAIQLVLASLVLMAPATAAATAVQFRATIPQADSSPASPLQIRFLNKDGTTQSVVNVVTIVKGENPKDKANKIAAAINTLKQ